MANTVRDQKKNLPESIRQKLRNLAAERKRPVDEILRYYAIERFLYRLSVSSHVDKFFLETRFVPNLAPRLSETGKMQVLRRSVNLRFSRGVIRSRLPVAASPGGDYP